MIDFCHLMCDLKVLTMINPSVTNAKHSQHYVAMVLDEVLSDLVPHFERKYLETSVKSSGGNTCDSRYFFEERL